jgi:hypothetical protein
MAPSVFQISAQLPAFDENSAAGRSSCRLANKVVQRFQSFTPPKSANIDGHVWTRTAFYQHAPSRPVSIYGVDPYQVIAVQAVWNNQTYQVTWDMGQPYNG